MYVYAHFIKKCYHSFQSTRGDFYALYVNEDILWPLISLVAIEMIIIILNLGLTCQKILAADKALQFIPML